MLSVRVLHAPCQMDAYSRMPWNAPVVAGASSMPYPVMSFSGVEMPVPAAFGQPVAASTVRARLLECSIAFRIYFVPCAVCQIIIIIIEIKRFCTHLVYVSVTAKHAKYLVYFW